MDALSLIQNDRLQYPQEQKNRRTEYSRMESSDHRDKWPEILELAWGSLDKYDTDYSVSDLERSIPLFQQVVDQTTQHDRHRLHGLMGLGSAYCEMFKEKRKIEDINKSIECLREAVDMTPEDDTGIIHRLKELGKAYHARYLEAENTTDRERCIEVWELSIELSMDSDYEDCDTLAFDIQWIAYLGELGDLYHGKYLDLGGMPHLERAIELYRQVVDSLPKDQPYRAGRIFHLGIAYGNKHQATGATEDLKQCISLYEDARKLLPKDHQKRPNLMENLGLAYRDRHLKTDSLEDIQLAIRLIEEAVDLTPKINPYRAGRVSNLGTLYGDKYKRTFDDGDLEKSLKLKEESSAETSNDAGRLVGLANGYATYFNQTRQIADLDRAIELNKRALALTPEDHLDQAHGLHSLGQNYHSRYEYDNEQYIEDLERSIQLKEAALNRTPKEDRLRAFRLSSLGDGYMERYYVSDDMSHWEQAIQVYDEALAHVSSAVQDRLKPGMELTEYYSIDGLWQKAYEAASRTIALLPLLTSPSLETSDKLNLLTKAAGLGSSLAAIALNCGQTPFSALQHVEHGRGVISQFMLGLRIDEISLRETHPDLADELSRLRAQVEAPAASMPLQENGRYDAGQKLEALTFKIRGMPGFDSALSAMSEDELKTAAKCGPIVTINISSYRCDALIIEQSRIWALELPNLMRYTLQNYPRHDRGRPEVLEWLWNNLAKPVLDALGFTQTPLDGCWPHIWWIPTGILTKFPIHAAGSYSQRSSGAVLDRVISSYSSSVKAIIHGRSRTLPPTQPSDEEKIVLVAMDKTPGNSDLKFASQEITKVESICKNLNLQISKPQPLQQDVLAAMNHCKIFHFAGHGDTHHTEPMQSRMLLKDWETTPLTVARLCETNLYTQKPFLAYLSACRTGHLEHNEFLEEGLHLIGACQLAGFRHVIGTLWEVQDQTCVDIALETYKWMQRRGINDESISEGLHHAVRSLRDRWMRDNNISRRTDSEVAAQNETVAETLNPSQRYVKRESDGQQQLFWVPYVHFGV